MWAFKTALFGSLKLSCRLFTNLEQFVQAGVNTWLCTGADQNTQALTKLFVICIVYDPDSIQPSYQVVPASLSKIAPVSNCASSFG